MRDTPIWQIGYSRHEEENERGSKAEYCGSGYRCAVCKGSCVCGDTVLFGNGDRVCASCREGYLEGKAYAFSEEYLEDNKEDFLAYIEERLM